MGLPQPHALSQPPKGDPGWLWEAPGLAGPIGFSVHFCCLEDKTRNIYLNRKQTYSFSHENPSILSVRPSEACDRGETESLIRGPSFILYVYIYYLHG